MAIKALKKVSGVGMGGNNGVPKLNPSDVRAALEQIFKAHDYDPFLELIRLATGFEEQAITDNDGNIIKVKVPIASVQQKIEIARELAQYIAPKLKSTEVTGHVDNHLHITVTKIGINGSKETKVIDVPSHQNSGAGQDIQKLVSDTVKHARGNVDLLDKDEE